MKRCFVYATGFIVTIRTPVIGHEKSSNFTILRNWQIIVVVITSSVVGSSAMNLGISLFIEPKHLIFSASIIFLVILHRSAKNIAAKFKDYGVNVGRTNATITMTSILFARLGLTH